MVGETPQRVPEEVVIKDPKVEVIAETRKRKKRKPTFQRTPSPVEGIEYVIEPGTDPQFGRGRTRRLKADADRIARWRKYETQAVKPRERLIQAAEEQPGFRGIVSARGNLETQVFPSSRKVIYDPSLLEKSTGPYHETLVRESGQLTIDLPFGSGEDGRQVLANFTQAVVRLMIESGRDPDEISALITPVIVQRLDEEELNRLIADGNVELLPGTRSETITWSTPVNPLDKRTTPQRQRVLGE